MAHIVPARVYYAIFGALVVLTGVTTGVAFFDLGDPWGAVVALTIAVVKATLVVLYFMHARYGSKLTWVWIGAGILWMAFLIGLTASDTQTRNWLPIPAAWTATTP